MFSTKEVSFLLLWVIVPYSVGCYFSSLLLPGNLFQVVAANVLGGGEDTSETERATGVNESQGVPKSHRRLSDNCERRFKQLFGSQNGVVKLEAATFSIHRNGDPDPCDAAGSGATFLDELRDNYVKLYENCPATLDKYQVESLLTQTFQNLVSSCYSLEKDRTKYDGFLGFCDMGTKKTPILVDHDDLVPVTTSNDKKYLPCRFHTREGLRITSFDQLTMIDPELQQCNEENPDGAVGTCTAQGQTSIEIHLYAVPAGRVFMFAPKYVGEIFHLPHVEGADTKPIYLEVLSLNPRLFDVFNFFSKDESEDLVAGAMQETRDAFRIKRSSTGVSGYNINSRRTSESGFDTHGRTSVKVKKRCFKALGFDEYWEPHGDGLQILRYNVTTAYNSHLDWIEDVGGKSEHDFESAGTGGNRFATILLYMTDLGPEDGGETVFPKGLPSGVSEADIDKRSALQHLRSSENGKVLEHGSWEEELVVQCRTRLAVRPHSARAVLFYSQYPNGEVDPYSLHGACPMLQGVKFAANLWVWNTPRQGYSGAPFKEKIKSRKTESVSNSPAPGSFTSIKAAFQNKGNDPDMTNAELYFGDQFWAKLGPNDPMTRVNTYETHVWNVLVDGKVVKSWTILERDGANQEFLI